MYVAYVTNDVIQSTNPYTSGEGEGEGVWERGGRGVAGNDMLYCTEPAAGENKAQNQTTQQQHQHLQRHQHHAAIQLWRFESHSPALHVCWCDDVRHSSQLYMYMCFPSARHVLHSSCVGRDALDDGDVQYDMTYLCLALYMS